MNRLLTTALRSALLVAASLAAAVAQTPPAALPPLPVTGNLNISYATRTAPGKPAIADTYSLRLNVANSILFHGSIQHRPLVKATLGADQGAQLTYDLQCDVVNPANPSQTLNIGRLYGAVPITAENVYRYDLGNATIAILPRGNVAGFESRFGGSAAGKPPAASGWAKVRQQTSAALSFTNAKGVTISVTKYDLMRFDNVTLAKGPVPIYGETVLSGVFTYDYQRSCWFLKDITASYTVGSTRQVDTLSGTIRWVETPARKSTGEGHYELDIKVNEPVPDVSAVFASTTVGAEDAFFSSNAAIAGLTGQLRYKDTILSNGTVTASAVAINLTSNALSKHQVVILSKLLFLVALVPLNAE